MRGSIKFYNEKKGFGFINGEDSDDYFFHVSQVEQGYTPRQADQVEFEPADNQKGKCANKVLRA